MVERSSQRWNVFARELEDILATRHLRLTQLDDRTFIHREKVRRLTRSLKSPKSFPVLNTQEMDLIETAFQLNENELLRLRAALLATAVEQLLMDRIHPDDALLATEQLFPILFATMQKYRFTPAGISAIRHEDDNESETASTEETLIDQALEPALEIFDRATMALHMSTVNAQTERVRYAREALHGFEASLAEMGEVEDTIQATDAWIVWYADIEKGLLTARQRLEELGEF